MSRPRTVWSASPSSITRAATAPASDPAQDETWTPVLIADDLPWVDHYRGLWGLDTEDPFGGERAPSGPKYNRDGTIRKSWYDPLGWAGLDKVTPPENLVPELEDEVETLRSRGKELEAEIRRQREKLRRLTLGVAALQESEFVSAIEKEQQKKRDQEEDALNELYAERISVLETRRAAEAYLARVRGGDLGDPQAHLRQQHKPAPPVTHLTRGAEFWSAISGGLLLALVAGLVYFRPAHWIWWLMGVGFGFFALEAVGARLSEQLLCSTSLYCWRLCRRSCCCSSSGSWPSWWRLWRWSPS